MDACGQSDHEEREKTKEKQQIRYKPDCFLWDTRSTGTASAIVTTWDQAEPTQRRTLTPRTQALSVLGTNTSTHSGSMCRDILPSTQVSRQEKAASASPRPPQPSPPRAGAQRSRPPGQESTTCSLSHPPAAAEDTTKAPPLKTVFLRPSREATRSQEQTALAWMLHKQGRTGPTSRAGNEGGQSPHTHVRSPRVPD